MQNSLKDKYIVIETDYELENVVKVLKKKQIIAVDMEADSMFHFQEKVCLIQMKAFDYPNIIIDTLKVENLSLLNPLFANPDIKKIFHGADFDVRSLYRDYKIVINNLFDTEIGSRYVGCKKTGLRAVILDRFNVKLEKKYQKKDWSQRPLPEEMLEYSAGDVNFLLPLEQILQKELIEKNRLKWVLEECELLSSVRPVQQNEEDRFLKIKGAGHLQPKNLLILKELLKLRTDIAKKKDKPLFKVISSNVLLKLSEQQPVSLNCLKNTRLLTEIQFSMYGQLIVEVIQKGINTEGCDLPIYPRKQSPILNVDVPLRIKILKKWRDLEANRLNLSPPLLLTKHHLTSIAIKNPSTIEELNEIDELKNWQKNEFGENIIQLLKNKED